jgi:hypothetical protein
MMIHKIEKIKKILIYTRDWKDVMRLKWKSCVKMIELAW